MISCKYKYIGNGMNGDKKQCKIIFKDIEFNEFYFHFEREFPKYLKSIKLPAATNSEFRMRKRN